jgi:membrane protein YdbS with pleckstrin-like domain
MVKKIVTEFQKEIKKQLVTMMTAAFGFVAALFWRDAVTAMLEEFVNPYLPAGNTWIPLTVSAIVVTVFAVVMIFVISRTVGRTK